MKKFIKIFHTLKFIKKTHYNAVYYTIIFIVQYICILGIIISHHHIILSRIVNYRYKINQILSKEYMFSVLSA